MNFELNSKQNPQNSKDSNKFEEISNLAELSKEKDIPKSITNQNEINSKTITQNTKEAKNLKINYGNIIILKYDKNGDPLLVIGPNYLSFFLFLFLNFLLIIFLSIVQYCYASFIIRIFGLLLSIIQISIYIYCSLKNPGYPKKAFQVPSLLNEKGGYYKKCKVCGIIVDLRKFPAHCNYCNICCEGISHHCNWTTKCIGAGNNFWFKSFLGSFFILISFFGFSSIWYEPSENKCRFRFFSYFS